MASYRLQVTGYGWTDVRTDGHMDRETCQLKYYFRYIDVCSDKILKNQTSRVKDILMQF